jgi:DNA excision repair protein ERCC-1
MADGGRFAAASGSTSGNTSARASQTPKKVVQPTPQALPSRAGPSHILVHTVQNGNPVLKAIRSMPWEYADIPADYVLGATTCALFLSLKYHKVRPEYIYSRFRKLQGKYALRILLVLIDIENHEETIKELSKTCVINNFTLMACWSAQEAGRYLELYKTYEHAPPTPIKSHQSTTYGDRATEFITTPRGINKTDAISLVSNFGSLRTAVNAQPEEVAMINGWGPKKVERWTRAVREPFRIKKAAKRGMERNDVTASTSIPREPSRPDGVDFFEDDDMEIGEPGLPGAEINAIIPTKGGTPDADRRRPIREAEEITTAGPDLDEKEALHEATTSTGHSKAAEIPAANSRKRPAEPEVSEGVMAALAKLRQNG